MQQEQEQEQAATQATAAGSSTGSAGSSIVSPSCADGLEECAWRWHEQRRRGDLHGRTLAQRIGSGFHRLVARYVSERLAATSVGDNPTHDLAVFREIIEQMKGPLLSAIGPDAFHEAAILADAWMVEPRWPLPPRDRKRKTQLVSFGTERDVFISRDGTASVSATGVLGLSADAMQDVVATLAIDLCWNEQAPAPVKGAGKGKPGAITACAVDWKVVDPAAQLFSGKAGKVPQIGTSRDKDKQSPIAGMPEDRQLRWTLLALRLFSPDASEYRVSHVYPRTGDYGWTGPISGDDIDGCAGVILGEMVSAQRRLDEYEATGVWPCRANNRCPSCQFGVGKDGDGTCPLMRKMVADANEFAGSQPVAITSEEVNRIATRAVAEMVTVAATPSLDADVEVVECRFCQQMIPKDEAEAASGDTWSCGKCEPPPAAAIAATVATGKSLLLGTYCPDCGAILVIRGFADPQCPKCGRTTTQTNDNPMPTTTPATTPMTPMTPPPTPTPTPATTAPSPSSQQAPQAQAQAPQAQADLVVAHRRSAQPRGKIVFTEANTPRRHYKIMVYGGPGLRKTRNFLRAFGGVSDPATRTTTKPKLLVSDLEYGTKPYDDQFRFMRIEEEINGRLHQLQDVDRIEDVLTGVLPPFIEGLMIDPFTMFCKLVYDRYVNLFLQTELASKGHKGDYYVVQPLEYKVINDHIRKFISKILALPYHFLCTAHAVNRWDRIGNTAKESDVEVADVWKRSAYLFDILIYTYRHNDMIVAEQDGKDRWNLLPPTGVPFLWEDDTLARLIAGEKPKLVNVPRDARPDPEHDSRHDEIVAKAEAEAKAAIAAAMAEQTKMAAPTPTRKPAADTTEVTAEVTAPATPAATASAPAPAPASDEIAARSQFINRIIVARKERKSVSGLEKKDLDDEYRAMLIGANGGVAVKSAHELSISVLEKLAMACEEKAKEPPF